MIIFVFSHLTFGHTETSPCMKSLNNQTFQIPHPTYVRKVSAELSLARAISFNQALAIEKAHLVGLGEPGLNGEPAKVKNYTQIQISKKYKILKQAGFSKVDIRYLMEDGIVGDRDKKPSDYNLPTREESSKRKRQKPRETHVTMDENGNIISVSNKPSVLERVKNRIFKPKDNNYED